MGATRACAQFFRNYSEKQNVILRKQIETMIIETHALKKERGDLQRKWKGEKEDKNRIVQILREKTEAWSLFRKESRKKDRFDFEFATFPHRLFLVTYVGFPYSFFFLFFLVFPPHAYDCKSNLKGERNESEKYWEMGRMWSYSKCARVFSRGARL